MEVLNSNNVKVYQIANSSKSAIPDWLARQKKKALKRDVNWQHRVELIQDFEFPEASIRLKPTRDSQYIVATGVYKPRMRVYDLAQMSMKFERHTDCENVQFEILSEDWSKVVMLQADRSIEFHTPLGMHYRTRIPRFGRDLAYHYPSCDLLVGGSGSEVYRLNLEQGKFLNSLVTRSPGINVTAINPAHQLWSFGGEDGFVEFWDHRSRQSVGRLDISSAVSGQFEISALKFMDDGLNYAVGTSTGQVVLYDIRSPIARIVKDHQYETPIRNIEFHSSGNVISADEKIIKIWNKDSGALYTSMEPDNKINDVCTFPKSGLLMTANEGTRMNIFYTPSLGPAPKWCSFLDNLTEELEENPNKNVYDDFKFVSRKELTELGLDNLIGTNLLKAYMHGFFISLRLYEKAKMISNPFAYEDYKKKIVQARLDEERKSRISAAKKLPKVNRSLAERLLKTGKKNPTQELQPQNPLGDERFADIFTNPDFQVDEDDPEYTRYHTKPRTQNSGVSNDFERVGDSEESELEGRPSDEESLFGEENNSDSDADDQLISKKYLSKRGDRQQQQQQRKVKFHEIKAGRSWGGQQQSGRQNRAQNRSFGKRLDRGEGAASNARGATVGGAKVMTFKMRGGNRK